MSHSGRISLISLIVFCIANTTEALDTSSVTQDTTKQTLMMKDGRVFLGKVVEIQDGVVVFVTAQDSVRFPMVEVATIRRNSAEMATVQQPRWRPNPHRTRLFFAPTGRTLDAGEGYLADHFIFFPALTLGLTDRLTAGGGVSIFPGVSISEQIFFATSKLGLLASQNVNVAAGALIGGFPGTDKIEGTAGVLFAVGTFGSLDQSITVGVGFGFLDGDLKGKPILVVGGEKRISSGVSLVSENWLVPDADPLGSFGVRLFGDFFSVDFGLMGGPFGDVGAFPYIDLVISFGRS